MLHFRYFREWESILNILIILSFPLISFHQNPFEEGGFKVWSWQYHVAGLGITVTWFINMILVGKVPKLGIYIHMFIAVGSSFGNFFLAFISIFFAFGLTFSVIFPDAAAFSETPFLTSPIKILVMMTGELEYNDLYYASYWDIEINNTAHSNETIHGVLKEGTQEQIFPFTGHALLTIFILVVSLIIMNMLFGMAVKDVQELHKISRLHLSAQQVKIISYMESSLLSPYLGKVSLIFQSGWDGFSLEDCDYRVEVELNRRNEKSLLPTDLKEALKNHMNKYSLLNNISYFTYFGNF